MQRFFVVSKDLIKFAACFGKCANGLGDGGEAPRIKIARKYHLQNEIKYARSMGLNPDEALEEWDLFPFEKNHFDGII